MSQAFIISDQESVGSRVRQVLATAGQDCPVSNMATLENAPGRVSQARPDLVVLVLHGDRERALSLLGEMRAKLNCRTLVVGPASDPKLVLSMLRGGADDFVDETELEGELKSALARLQAGAAANMTEPGKIIAVLGPSGGCGSSTLAANIATVLAKEHKTALLVDLKLETGDLASLLDLKPNYTLANLCQNVNRMDRVMLERSLAQHASGVHLLASPQVFADIGHVTPDGVQQALSLARVLFPYIVIDLDHTFRSEQTKVLRMADVVLVVLRLEFTSLRNARRALDHLEQMGIPRDHIKLVVNRYGQAKEVPASKAEEALGMKIAHYVPEDAKSIIRANNNGVPVVLEAPSTKVSKSVSILARSVNGRPKDH